MNSRRLLVLEIEAEDVGATMVVHVSIGGRHIDSFFMGTRYADRALDDAEHALAQGFKPLVRSCFIEAGNTSYIECPYCGVRDGEHLEWCDYDKYFDREGKQK